MLCFFRTSAEFSPVIARGDNNCAYRRGIVWEKMSTNKHSILFVDTLEITEVQRKLIQKCPKELLGTLVPFAKVHLSRVKPNARMRAFDICNELDQIIMNKNLIAYVTDRHDNGVLKVKLYESEHAKQSIYKSLIKQKFYKMIPS